MPLKNTLFLEALSQKNKGRPPIWLYRQAGRYMPQYQDIRKKYSIKAMFNNDELITKITLLPVEHLDVDAAILFADILTVLDAFHIQWEIVDGEGPVIESLRGPLERKNSSFPHIVKAIKALKASLDRPLIGFVGGPLTVASYLLDKKNRHELKEIKKWIYLQPERLHALLETLTEATIDYAKLQIDAGVDALQIFDTWAGNLTPSAFEQFSLPYLQKIKQHISKPLILFCRGSCTYAEKLSSLQPDAIGFDPLGNLKDLSQRVSCSVQGNLDPLILLGSRTYLTSEVDRILRTMEGSPRFIFNLGHGILPETPYANVQFCIEHVKRLSS